MIDTETLEEEIARLKKEVANLKAIVLEMKEVIKVLTEGEERAKNFIARIEELSEGIREDRG